MAYADDVVTDIYATINNAGAGKRWTYHRGKCWCTL